MDFDLTHYDPQRAHLIERAYRLAQKHNLHETISLGQTTSVFNGSETARLLIDWQLDAETVATSLIIPLVFSEIEDELVLAHETNSACVELARTVLHLAELNSRLSRNPNYAQTPVNMRELLLHETQDMRTLIIWLATRLVALRRQDDQELQKMVARRCNDIYAPIADLLGMGNVKAEMEEYSLKVLEPKQYKDLERMLKRQYKQIDRFLASAKHELKQILSAGGLKEFEVMGRSKHLASIKKKLPKAQKVSEIYDLVALRVITTTEDECYQALNAIHGQWEPLPNRIKDYIARPKPNGYRSLHTTVSGPKGGIIEIQIRTRQMHQEAEEGLAAHFYYDQHKESKDYQRGVHAPVATHIQDIGKLHKALRAHRVIDPSKLELNFFEDQVYVFSPKGDLYSLPQNSVALDFAFAIHTDIGLRTKAIKVNGKIAKLDRPLANGDVVEILTNKQPKPRSDWVKMVRSAKAKSKIRSHLEGQGR